LGNASKQTGGTMANVQKQFEEFHKNIRLGRFDQEATLRDKRDIIRRKLEENLPTVFEKYGEECPEFYFEDQGSYEMGTGTKPPGGDYDIDQGLYMKVKRDDHPDPVVLKKRVHEALEGHTDDVCIRRPCVTVFYHKAGERIYHVDIAVYSDGSQNTDGKDYLALGREHSSDENRYWEVSNPKALADEIFRRFLDEADRAQLRRNIRYLKRWKDHKFAAHGNAAPLGIGLTVAASKWLQPFYTDVFARKPDDLRALRDLVSTMLKYFTLTYHDGEWVCRLAVRLPVEPWNDLFERMTNKQMAAFEEKLKALKDALDDAADEADPVEACETLRKQFGDDFPVPEKSETAQKRSRAIVSSSESA